MSWRGPRRSAWEWSGRLHRPLVGVGCIVAGSSLSRPQLLSGLVGVGASPSDTCLDRSAVVGVRATARPSTVEAYSREHVDESRVGVLSRWCRLSTTPSPHARRSRAPSGKRLIGMRTRRDSWPGASPVPTPQRQKTSETKSSDLAHRPDRGRSIGLGNGGSAYRFGTDTYAFKASSCMVFQALSGRVPLLGPGDAPRTSASAR